MNRVLIVEDDSDINQLLYKMLKKNDYEPEQAFSGTEARLMLSMNSYDFILMDLMLPGMNGEELLKHIRRERNLQIPIIILSAKTALKDKVELLSIGADDYLTKPFEPEEVLARMTAVLRRYQKENPSAAEKTSGQEFYTYKKLTVFPESRKAEVNGTELSLTAHEFDILLLLIQHPDKVYSRENLYEQVWKNGYYGEDNTVNVHVSNLRKKLAAADTGEEYIKTVWGIGFKLV